MNKTHAHQLAVHGWQFALRGFSLTASPKQLSNRNLPTTNWKPFLWIPALLALFAISCVQVSEEKLKEVKNLRASLDEVKMTLNGIDTTEVAQMHATAVATLQYIGPNYGRDMPKDVAIMLADYRSTRKLLGWILDRHQQQSAEHRYATSQMDAMIKDIEYNLMTEKELNEHLPKEAKVIEALLNDAMILEERYMRAMEEYKTRNAKAQEILADTKAYNSKS